MKFFSLVIDQNEHLSIVANRLMKTYEKRMYLNTNSMNRRNTDCVYLIVYFK